MTNKRNYNGRIASTLAAGAMLLPGAGYAQNPVKGEVELFSDGGITTTDTKVLVPSVNPNGTLLKKLGMFLRNRNTVDSRETQITSGSFSLGDVTYNVLGGLDAVYEHQFLPNGQSVPLVGAQYFTKMGRNKDLTLYGLGVVSLRDDEQIPRYAEVIGKVAYNPKLTENLKGVAQLEAVTNFGGNGVNFAVQRARLGIEHKNGFAGGIGADIVETPSKTGDVAIDKVVGLWLRKSF